MSDCSLFLSFLHQSHLLLSLPPVKSSMSSFRMWQRWRLREGWATPGGVCCVCIGLEIKHWQFCRITEFLFLFVCFSISSCLCVLQGMFEPYLKSFYIRSTDPTQIKVLKVAFCSLLPIAGGFSSSVCISVWTQSIFFVSFAAGGSHQSGQWDKYFHHSQRISGTMKGNEADALRTNCLSANQSMFFFCLTGRHTLKAWIKILWLQQSKPLAAVLRTLARCGTRVWMVWCSCCPTETVRLEYSRHFLMGHLYHI